MYFLVVLLIMMFKMVLTFQSSDKLVNVTFQKKVTGRYFGTVLYYRKWSSKRRGAYFIFPVKDAALILTTGETLRGILRELSEVRTRYAQFNINYVYLELLYQPGFKIFPTLKL